jgi:YegS/Rv2252/BmrU family lipid kinase
MISSRKIAVVVNPLSAGGKTARQWPGIRRVLEERLGNFQVCLTNKKGDGTKLARALLREGCDLIIAAGGDGTVNEVANGFLENDRPASPKSCLGILPLGTGGDFRRTLGIGAGIEAAIETLASGAPALLDVGKVSFVGHDGSPSRRYFTNVASFGMGGEVATRSQNAARRLGGRAAFLWATFRTTLGYRGKTIRLTLDGVPQAAEFFVTHVALGNGEFQGGGMHPCPRAVLNDGLLDVTVIEYLNLFELARDIHILYSEDVYAHHHPKVHQFRARRIAAESRESTHVEVDGEPLGRLPLEATVLAACLRMLVPAESPLLGKSGV